MSKRRKNILWIFIMAFFVAESLLGLFANYIYQSKRDHILEDRTDQLETNYESIFNTYRLVSSLIYKQVISTPQILELYSRAYTSKEEQRSEIRDSLYQLLSPIYSELNPQAVRQLHFHLPDNRSFLRFHNPAKFGDDLTDSREIVRITNKEKRFVQGFEIGKSCNSFRFVYPLSHLDKHIGSVEASVSFGAINHMPYEQTENIFAFILRRSVVEEKVFEEIRKNYVISTISDQWLEEQRFLHDEKTNDKFSKETLKDLDNLIKRRYQNRLDEGKAFSVLLDLDQNKYTVSFMPVLNIKEEHEAYLMSYNLDTHIDGYISGATILFGGGSLLILVIIILIYVIYSKNLTIEDQYNVLKETESRYQHIYNTVEVGVISNTLDGKILIANPKMIEILGYADLQEFKRVNIRNFYLDQNDQKKLRDPLLSSENAQVDEEVSWKKKDGSIIRVRIMGKNHLDSENKHYIISVIQDVTSIRALEESLRSSEASLRESNAAKDRFFSIIAHDLRGPFNSLKGLVELLAINPESVDEERKKRFIQLIYLSVRNLSNLIENLLEWSRSQQGVLNFEPKEMELAPIIKETVELLSEAVFAKKISIQVDLDKNIELLADENMTKAVFRNLLSNAIKFTHNEGRIKIFLGELIGTDNDRFVEIIIEDNGVGITENDLGKLFKIDSGFSNPGTENEKGTGLGLVLVKEFVEKHHGNIIVKSEVEMGTKIIFTLPIVS